MKNASKGFQRHLARVEASMKQTAHLQQALAQLEATLSRRENQKVTEKSQKK